MSSPRLEEPRLQWLDYPRPKRASLNRVGSQKSQSNHSVIQIEESRPEEVEVVRSKYHTPTPRQPAVILYYFRIMEVVSPA